MEVGDGKEGAGTGGLGRCWHFVLGLKEAFRDLRLRASRKLQFVLKSGEILVFFCKPLQGVRTSDLQQQMMGEQIRNDRGLQ